MRTVSQEVIPIMTKAYCDCGKEIVGNGLFRCPDCGEYNVFEGTYPKITYKSVEGDGK